VPSVGPGTSKRRAKTSQPPPSCPKLSQTTVKALPAGSYATRETAGHRILLERRRCGSGIASHARGDWGEVHPEDARANDEALLSGERLLSSYRLADGTKLWIITEADRSSTCLLLPEEY
jgi:hypothetical protein